MKKNLFLFVLLLLFLPVKSQTFGNEWINYNQKYFKIKIGTEGIYHLDYTTLIDAAIEMKIELGTINPKKWQIFYQGKEIPIFVSGENDNQFNNYDYIEFYGKLNDGSLDEELYSQALFQPQKSRSLIADSGSYYLTFLPNSSLSEGWHMKTYKDTNFASYPAEPYFIFQKNYNFSSFYNAGKPFDIAGFPTYNPEYTRAEGFCGIPFGFGQSSGLQFKDEIINTNFISPNGPLPLLTYTTVGTNDNVNEPLDHHLKVSASPDNTTFSQIDDQTFDGYSIVNRSLSLSRNLFGSNTTTLRFEGIYVNNVAIQGNAISEFNIKYPRDFDLDDNSTMPFSVNGNTNPRHINWINYKSTRSKPVIYDFTSGTRIKGIIYSGNKMHFILPPNTNPTTDCYLLDSLDIKTVTNRQVEPAISFESLDKYLIGYNPTNTQNKNKLILITNEKFVGDYTDNYIKLKGQRTNTSPCTMVTVQQLYNNFSYGVPHPIAIRRFIRFLKEKGDTTLKFVFLVGRGFQTDLMRSNGFQNLNYVPSIGVPASDNMFACDINGSGVAPAVSIGRLTVDRAIDFGIYISKLEEMANSPDASWRKEVLHLAGGEDGAQTAVIKRKFDGYKSIVEDIPFGGRASMLAKSASGISDPFLTSRLIDYIDSGKQLVTFFGHGSAITTDVDMGDTSEYHNYGKYPVFYFNGCSIGNPCLGPPSKSNKLSGENFLKADRIGAIAFIGQTGLTELNVVSQQMNEFYKLAFQTSYTGNYTIGETVKDAIYNFQDQSYELNIIINRLMFLQGDPSIAWYQPQLPDYSITNTSISLYPKNLTAISDSFAVAVTVENTGKYVSDSFNIRIERTYPNDFLKTTYNFRVPGVKNKTTFYLYIKSKDIATAGYNDFSVHVNDLESPKESTMSNNMGKLNVLIPGNGIHLIYPKRFAIVSNLNNDSVELIAQALNIFENNYQFKFEIDTVPEFNSPWLQKDSTQNIVGQIKRWKVKLNASRDSIVYYWRAMIITGSNLGGQFVDRSFIHIFNNEPGWSQSHFPQFLSSSRLNRINLNKNRRQFEYTTNSEYVYVNTSIRTYPNYGIKKGGQAGVSLNPGAPFGGIVAVLFDKNTLAQFRLNDIFQPNAYALDPNTGLYDKLEVVRKFYNFSVGYQVGNDQFTRWVDSIPDSTYVAICSRTFVNRQNWTPAVVDRFSKLGCKITDNVFGVNTSFAMIGKKGSAPGTAAEDTGIWYSDANDQSYIEVQREMIGKYDYGTVKTELIGPSSDWKNLYFYTQTNDPKPGDDFYINVHGLSNSGTDTIWYENVRTDALDISAIDANKFPNIYLEGVFTDKNNYTPPQLKHWRVTAGDVPEGALNPNLSQSVWRDSLKQGEIFNYEIGFENISSLQFATNLRYQVKIFNIDTRDTVYDSTYFYTNHLNPDAHFLIPAKFATNKMKGRYAYLVKVNFDQFSKAELPELSLVNNSAIRYFEVLEDIINPLLDVTFNGRHITNGEIVSANPTILISSKDENTYNWQIDSTGIKLWWKKPNSTQFEKINFDSFGVKFYPATSVQNIAKAEFSPKNLSDGIYTLKVQSNDANLNNAGATEYQINFQVINEKSATNFYPYPNPFTTAMRFVFTLTGNEVPDYINIKIMTIQGKVVKEINKDDLGHVNIGSNISDVVWDGTDQFGDRLSNGVYLYTVTIKSGGETLNQISSDNVSNDLNADKANNNLFKHHTGKIVLLR